MESFTGSQSWRRRSALALASLAALATLTTGPGCVGSEDEPALGTDQESIFANVPGAHAVGQNIDWDDVAYDLPSGYALASWKVVGGTYPENVVNAIYRDAAGCLRRRYMSDLDGLWHTDAALASCEDPGFGSDPAAVAWGPNRLDLFWFVFSFAAPPHLHHAFLDTGVWRYEDLGATATAPTYAPAAGSWGVGHLDVMWRDAAGMLRWRAFDRGKRGAPGYNASGWATTDSQLPVYLTNTQIAMVEGQLSDVHVAYRLSNGKLAHYYTTDYYNWTWENTGITIDTPPTLASWGPWHLLIFARRGTNLRQIQKTGTTWTDSAIVSTAGFGNPVAAAALGRPERIDFLGSPDGETLVHTLYQESIPNFRSLWNPYTSHWCWANVAAMVIDVLYDADYRTCDIVSLDVGEDCCAAVPDSSCITTGSAGSVLSDWGIGWTDGDPLTASQLRYQLQVLHKPVISYHDVSWSLVNHYVVLRELYAIDGVTYVVIADPGDNGRSWVWPYATYLAYDTNWYVHSMQYNLHTLR